MQDSQDMTSMLWMVVRSLAMYNSKCLSSCISFSLSPASGDISLHLSCKFLQWIWSPGRCCCISSQTVVRLLCLLKTAPLWAGHTSTSFCKLMISLSSCCLPFILLLDVMTSMSHLMISFKFWSHWRAAGLQWPLLQVQWLAYRSYTLLEHSSYTHTRVSAFGSRVWIRLEMFENLRDCKFCGGCPDRHLACIIHQALDNGCIPSCVYCTKYERTQCLKWDCFVNFELFYIHWGDKDAKPLVAEFGQTICMICTRLASRTAKGTMHMDVMLSTTRAFSCSNMKVRIMWSHVILESIHCFDL